MGPTCSLMQPLVDEETKAKYYYNRKQRSSVWDLPEGATTKLAALGGSSRSGSARSQNEEGEGEGLRRGSTSSIMKKLSMTKTLSDRSGTSRAGDLESLGAAEPKQWFFLDEANDRQGPFSSYEMRQWVEAGYFDETLRVLQQGAQGNAEFATLQELFGGLDKCFPDGIAEDDGSIRGRNSRASSSAQSSDVGEESNLGGVVAEEELEEDDSQATKPELVTSLSTDSIRAGATRRRSQTVGHLVKNTPLIGRSMLQDFASNVVREDDGVAEDDEDDGKLNEKEAKDRLQSSFHRRQPSPSSPERFLGKHALASRSQLATKGSKNGENSAEAGPPM